MVNNAVKAFVTKHTPPVLSILLSIGSAAYYIGNEVKTGFTEMKTGLIHEARLPFYLDKEYALRKQIEKLNKDPDDLKVTDIELLYILCSSEFGTDYIPTLQANRRANAENACNKITNLYIKKDIF